MTQEVKGEVRRLLISGERGKAIAYLETAFNISFHHASLLVETLEREISPSVTEAVVPPPSQQTPATLDGSLKAEVMELLKTRRQSEAVRRVREKLNLGMKDALVLVGQVAREQNPNMVSFSPRGCLQVVARGLGIFLMVVSLLFLGIAAIIYFKQARSIASSDRVEGVVSEMKSLDTGESAPLLEFEWRGKKRSFESTFYSYPPDYEVGQRLFLFVNRDDPEDVTLDTFEDRWALIVGLSVPGGVFLLISIVILQFAKRKF